LRHHEESLNDNNDTGDTSLDNNIKKQNSSHKKRRRSRVTATISPSISTPKYKRKIVTGPRDYEYVPVTEFKKEQAPDEENKGLRRSSRAKFPPLQYWRNEKIEYTANEEFDINDEDACDMPVVAGVVLANETPFKLKTIQKKKRKQSLSTTITPSKKKGQHKEPSPFKATSLKKKYVIIDDNKATIWDEKLNTTSEKTVISTSLQRRGTALPITIRRLPSESRVTGTAAQAFNISQVSSEIPGWICGTLNLPPRAIKDAEGVGLCTQIFFVSACQPQSVEMALAHPSEEEFCATTAQRFLLSAGDYFYVPPNNIYRVENHSRTTEALLNWTIVRPVKDQGGQLL